MPGFIGKKLDVLVLVLLCFGESLTIKCISLNNQSCLVRPTLIDLNPGELYYHPVTITPNRCDGSCNTTKDPFGRICIPNKMEDVNLKVLEMIKGITESKTLAKHISCDRRCEFDGRKCNSRQKGTITIVSMNVIYQ